MKADTEIKGITWCQLTDESYLSVILYCVSQNIQWNNYVYTPSARNQGGGA